MDCTILPAMSSIASTQANATEETEQRVKQLLDYLATLPNAKIRFYASNMVLNVHSDASYLSETDAKSRAVGMYSSTTAIRTPGNRDTTEIGSSIFRDTA